MFGIRVTWNGRNSVVKAGLLLLLSILGPESLWGKIQDDKAVCEVFQNLLLNVKAIESGDVLMVCREEYDSISPTDSESGEDIVNPDGSLVDSVTTVRSRFNIKNNSHACIIHKKIVQTRIKPKEGAKDQLAKKNYESLEVVLIRNRERVEMKWSPSEAKMQKRSTKILQDDNFPDDLPNFRSSVYSGTLEPSPWAKTVGSVERAASGKDYWRSSREKDGNLRVVFRSELVGQGLDCLYYDYLIDAESQMVISSEMYHADLFGNNRAIGFRNKSQWNLMSQIYVPAEMKYEAPRQVRLPKWDDESPEDRSGIYWVYRDLDFHWHSLNEEAQEEWFEESSYDSIDKIKALLFAEKEKIDESGNPK